MFRCSRVDSPGHIPAKSTVTAPVAHRPDANIAAAAGGSVPAGVEIDGVSLLPFATGAAIPGQTPHSAIWQSASTRPYVRATGSCR